MKDLSTRIAVGLVRAWTRLYTAGLPAELRDRRRAEIESDVWESCREPRGRTVAGQMLVRLLLGVRDDLAWRGSCGEPSRIVRAALIAGIATMVLAATLLVIVGRSAAETLPAPVPMVHHVRALPPPPPPPPPPCVPPSLGRPSPSPCTN
jgi:hypothetical protein